MPEDWEPGKPFRVPDPTDPTGKEDYLITPFLK